MAQETKLPGEVDEGVVSFRDLPGKKEYVVITDVPVLDEHRLTGDGENDEEWIGPERLQEIANNNNKRIRETGDAAPITIGHTKDGANESSQPPVVGYATDFKVAPLLNANRMAIYANFHILKDKLDEVRNYPRRSVELWPKRWEIDPIALLGATTPERDLGLLQLSKKGKPIRYRRVLNEEPEMADEFEDEGAGAKPPKAAKKTPPPDDGDDDGGGDDEAGGLDPASEKIAQRVLALLMESGPIKELMAAAQGQAPGGAGGDPNDPSMAGGPQGQPPMGGDPSGMGGGRSESRFEHEGPPERYEDDGDGNGDDYDYEEPERYMGYASPTNTYIPDDDGGEHTMNGHRSRGYTPYGGDAFYEDHQEQPMRRASSRERYERYLAEQEAARRPVQRQRQSPVRRQAAASDASVAAKKETDKVSRLEVEVRKLRREKTEAERVAVLSNLQREGYVLEVADEMTDCGDMSHEQFSAHVARIKKRYARDPSGVMPIRMVDDASPPVRHQRPRTPIEGAKLGQAIGGYMAEHPGCDYKTAEAAVIAEQQSKTR